MKTVYPDENNVVLYEKSVERKPYINRKIKSLELTIQLYSCHDIKMKFLLVVTPPSIYHIPRSGPLTIRNLTKNTPTYDVKFAALPIREINLNFGIDASGSML